MSTRKTKKEPTSELELEEEEAKSSEEVESFGEDLESEEEAEPITPLLEKKKNIKTLEENCAICNRPKNN